MGSYRGSRRKGHGEREGKQAERETFEDERRKRKAKRRYRGVVVRVMYAFIIMAPPVGKYTGDAQVVWHRF